MSRSRTTQNPADRESGRHRKQERDRKSSGVVWKSVPPPIGVSSFYQISDSTRPPSMSLKSLKGSKGLTVINSLVCMIPCSAQSNIHPGVWKTEAKTKTIIRLINKLSTFLSQLSVNVVGERYVVAIAPTSYKWHQQHELSWPHFFLQWEEVPIRHPSFL